MMLETNLRMRENKEGMSGGQWVPLRLNPIDLTLYMQRRIYQKACA